MKGGQTRDVWFYKTANDGYTMGTNRKPIPGCHLVEALDLFHRYVRAGRTPPETRHSFSITAARGCAASPGCTPILLRQPPPKSSIATLNIWPKSHDIQPLAWGIAHHLTGRRKNNANVL